MTVDIIATAIYMKNCDHPKCLVFTSVLHPDMQFVIEPSAHQLIAVNPVRVVEFYNDYLQDEWIQDSIGCVDPKTFLYLMKLIPRVHYLGSFGYQDPFEKGKKVAMALQCGK